MRNLIEKFALWLLKVIGTEIWVVPIRIKPYYPEILSLVREEEGKVYDAPDMHGDGYFKTRRVIAKMLRDHPELRNDKRALLKGIIQCSDRITSV